MKILPIRAYGDPVLRQRAKFIDKDHPGLQELIDNMWTTMYRAQGVGLAAPQVGESIRLFVIDATPYAEEDPLLDGFKKVFINAEILEETGKEWLFNEGCLSFPELREDIKRQPVIRMRFQDEAFNTYEETFEGLAARIIQHEYDHIEGVLMVDHFSPLKKRLLKKKLHNISAGRLATSYPMKFPIRK
ncbi:MAG: peptide deformylase [Bacteroidia bacterium]|nr:MAG: peptide deformylase [Bacteroidia bacterium]